MEHNRSEQNETEAIEANGGVGETIVLESEALEPKNQTTSCDGRCEWRKKYDEIKKSYLKLTVRHCEVSIKHDELLKAATNSDRLIISGESELMSSDDIFTVNELRCLDSVSLERKKDSNFILQCIQFAYKSNKSELLNRTLKGRHERVEIKDDGSVERIQPAKTPLTPEKVTRIEELFINRVSKSKCVAAEFSERIKQTNINKLIASAIKNVSNKEKSLVKLPTENVDLEL